MQNGRQYNMLKEIFYAKKWFLGIFYIDYPYIKYMSEECGMTVINFGNGRIQLSYPLKDFLNPDLWTFEYDPIFFRNYRDNKFVESYHNARKAKLPSKEAIDKLMGDKN